MKRYAKKLSYRDQKNFKQNTLKKRLQSKLTLPTKDYTQLQFIFL